MPASAELVDKVVKAGTPAKEVKDIKESDEQLQNAEVSNA